jgi:uncharacterized cupredoxin-like copper-binding protein
MAFAACGDDDDATPTPAPTPDPAQIAEVEDTFTKMLETDPTSDAEVDFFLEHITADAVKYFGYPTADECRAAAEDCIGDPIPVDSMSDTEISGDNASSNANTADGLVRGVFVRQGDAWKLNGYAFNAPEIPSGANMVDVSAVDYGYDWDKGGLSVGDPIVFSMKNDGQEAHMIVLAAVEDDFDPQVMIDSLPDLGPDDNPAGVTEFLDGFTAATPGETGSILLADGLEAGKYTFICFIPNPEGKQHVELGMYSEFEVAE